MHYEAISVRFPSPSPLASSLTVAMELGINDITGEEYVLAMCVCVEMKAGICRLNEHGQQNIR